MVGIDKATMKVVLAEWQRQFPDLRPLTKHLWARVNGFVMVGLEFRDSSTTSSYPIRVFLYCLNHVGDAGEIYFDASTDYWYSLGQHRLGGVKYLGTIEEFADFCDRVRRETVLSPDLDIGKAIAFCEAHPSGFAGIQAVATAWFVLAGVDRAAAYLDTQEATFARFNDAIRGMLGGSWERWRQRVLDSLDLARIEAQAAATLARFAKRGLHDYGIRQS